MDKLPPSSRVTGREESPEDIFGTKPAGKKRSNVASSHKPIQSSDRFRPADPIGERQEMIGTLAEEIPKAVPYKFLLGKSQLETVYSQVRRLPAGQELKHLDMALDQLSAKPKWYHFRETLRQGDKGYNDMRSQLADHIRELKLNYAPTRPSQALDAPPPPVRARASVREISPSPQLSPGHTPRTARTVMAGASQPVGVKARAAQIHQEWFLGVDGKRAVGYADDSKEKQALIAELHNNPDLYAEFEKLAYKKK
ncbi:MAG: hypothetical protein V4534_04625 [Myxococcota bacterium]